MNDDLKDEIDTLQSIYNADELEIDYRPTSTYICYTATLQTSIDLNISFDINNERNNSTQISVTNKENTIKTIPPHILKKIQDTLIEKHQEEIDAMPIFQCISFCNDELLQYEPLNLVKELKQIKPKRNNKDIERAFWSEVDKYRKEFKKNGVNLMKYRYSFGDRVRVKHINCNGTVRYIGSRDKQSGIWYGIELDEAKGENNGIIEDKMYFECKQKYGIFVSADNNHNIRNIKDVLMKDVDSDDIKQIDDDVIMINDNKESVDDVEETKECVYKVAEINEYAVNYDHVTIQVKEFSDTMKVDGKKYNGRELVKIFDKIKVGKEELSLWAGYWGSELFTDKTDARNRLRDVVEFAEGNKSCSKHIKEKLRVITQLIMKKGTNNSCEYVHILLLIASHGNVCNVMKEVAIGNAYGLMTDKLDDFVKEQSLEQQIYKVLRDYRVLLVEVLFHSFGIQNNTHYIAGFHNVLAKDIGVTPYNDPDICIPSSTRCKDWRKNLDKRYFKTLYTKSNIIKHVLEQIKEKKIGYQNVVKFMEDKCPKDVDKISFLQQAIDIDTGKIHEDYICWILCKLKVFMMKSDDWKPIEKCWDDIKPK